MSRLHILLFKCCVLSASVTSRQKTLAHAHRTRSHQVSVRVERERENRIEKRQSEKDTYSTHCTHWHRHQAHALSNVYNYDLCLARSCCYYMPLCFHFLPYHCCWIIFILFIYFFFFIWLVLYTLGGFFSSIIFGIVSKRQISNLLRVIKRYKMRK